MIKFHVQILYLHCAILVLRPVYSKHLTWDEWPYVRPVCQYHHFDLANFRKHPQWYFLHAALKDYCSVPMSSSTDITESSKLAYDMMKQLTVVESAQHWQQHRRILLLSKDR